MKLPSVLQAASANSSLIRREATDRTLMDLCLRPYTKERDEAVQTSHMCYLSSCRKTNLRARIQCLRSCSALYSARANATPKRRDC